MADARQRDGVLRNAGGGYETRRRAVGERAPRHVQLDDEHQLRQVDAHLGDRSGDQDLDRRPLRRAAQSFVKSFDDLLHDHQCLGRGLVECLGRDELTNKPEAQALVIVKKIVKTLVRVDDGIRTRDPIGDQISSLTP